jgi:hypothetical protein
MQGHEAHEGEMIIQIKFKSENPKRRDHWKPKCRCEDSIKNGLTETENDGLNLSGPLQGLNHGGNCMYHLFPSSKTPHFAHRIHL